jgi:hypothetical protein
MQFKLVIRHPKTRDVGLGTLSVDKTGEAMFFAGNGEAGAAVLATMQRARIEFAAADGLLLSGMQPEGVDRHGRQKFSFQEWWLTYPKVVA